MNLSHTQTSKPLALVPVLTGSIIDANSSFIRYNKMSETSKGGRVAEVSRQASHVSATVTDTRVTLNLPVIVIVNLEVKPTAGISKIHTSRSRKCIKIRARQLRLCSAGNKLGYFPCCLADCTDGDTCLQTCVLSQFKGSFSYGTHHSSCSRTPIQRNDISAE